MCILFGNFWYLFVIWIFVFFVIFLYFDILLVRGPCLGKSPPQLTMLGEVCTTKDWKITCFVLSWRHVGGLEAFLGGLGGLGGSWKPSLGSTSRNYLLTIPSGITAAPSNLACRFVAVKCWLQSHLKWYDRCCCCSQECPRDHHSRTLGGHLGSLSIREI